MTVFISYRRVNSQSAAGRLARDLEGKGITVFHDVVSIRPGADFVQVIEQALSASVVMLVIIGPGWVTRRLNDPSDYHRQEIARALTLKRAVIPVLVEGAKMPEAQDLPEVLQRLAGCNAHELTDRRWDYDVSELAKEIKRLLGRSAETRCVMVRCVYGGYIPVVRPR